jgi:predicted nucleic acid-binding protein
LKAVLLDTDILIEVLRQRDDAILERWRQLGRGCSARLRVVDAQP